jgi:TDG/mug DNA glycosylase family protein
MAFAPAWHRIRPCPGVEGAAEGPGWRPSSAELAEARNTTVPDVIAPGLRVLFCGVNPSLWSAAVGHHFARPGNRFWIALHRSGFTDRRLSPDEDTRLLEYGLGCTNLVARATARADELSPEELRWGAERLCRLVLHQRPAWLAVLGLGAYRAAFARPSAAPGLQAEMVGDTRVWLLPNPSGRNAHHQLPALVAAFAELRAATE